MVHNETERHYQIMASAALLFSKQGYKKTAVDEIVAKAGISKGLFYHYFKNKKELYLHLYNTYAALLSHAVLEKVDLSETDFFQRLKQIAYIRIAFISEHPNLWNFLYSAYFEEHSDMKPLIKETNETLLRNSFSGAASNIDWGKLKKGLTPEKAIEIVTWIAEGFIKKISENNTAASSELFYQFDEYMECMKTGLYEDRKE